MKFSAKFPVLSRRAKYNADFKSAHNFFIFCIFMRCGHLNTTRFDKKSSMFSAVII